MQGVKVILESGLHIFIKITFSFLIPKSSSFWEAFLPCYRDDSGSRRDGSGVINLRDSGGINPPLTFPYPLPPAELCEKWHFDCSRTLPLMYMLGDACNCYSANCLTRQVCVPPGGEAGASAPCPRPPPSPGAMLSGLGGCCVVPVSSTCSLSRAQQQGRKNFHFRLNIDYI